MDRTADRYTSPDLSRQLAEAGLEQNYSGDYWHRNPGLADDEDPWFTARWDDPECRDSSVRALRLDDVLEELTRDREGGPLATGGEYTFGWTGFKTDVGERVTHIFRSHENTIQKPWTEGRGTSPVEAAGLVLLALLRERGGK